MNVTKQSYSGELKKFRHYLRGHAAEFAYYVYALVDPDTKQVFYIGKGKGIRMFSHIFESFSSKSLNDEIFVGEKIERIQKIHSSGNKVDMFILHYGLTNEHAFIVESVLIDVFSNFKSIDTQAIADLTNGMNGYDHIKGFCNIDTLCQSTEANKKIDILPGEKILAIKISGTETKDDDILERVRKHWRINQTRANKATYVAACRNGIVIGLYVNKSGWIQVQNPVNPNDEGRFYFEGVSVNDTSIRERYINRYIEIPRGARYPIMYVGGWT